MIARLYSLTALLVALAHWVELVHAQGGATTVPPPSLTSSPTGSTTRSSTRRSTGTAFQYTQTACYQTTTVSGIPTRAPVPAGVGLPDGAICYRFSPSGSSAFTTIHRTASTTALVPGVTIFPSPSPSSGNTGSGSSNSNGSSTSSGSSGGKNIGLIVGATVGAVAGLILIIVGLVFLRKHRKKSKLDRTWVNRPGGWVQDHDAHAGPEKRNSDNIVLKDRNSKDSPMSPPPHRPYEV